MRRRGTGIWVQKDQFFIRKILLSIILLRLDLIVMFNSRIQCTIVRFLVHEGDVRSGQLHRSSMLLSDRKSSYEVCNK